MKSFILLFSFVLMVQNIYATEFKDCTYKKIERGEKELFMVFNCGKNDRQKCYVNSKQGGYYDIDDRSIWNSLPQKGLTIERSIESGKDQITRYENGRLDGWFVGDCIAIYSSDKMYDVAKGKISLKRTDNIKLAFKNDPDVIGKWVAVDFVENKEEFNPDKKLLEGALFLKSITFYPKGKTDKPFWTWTKHVLIHSGDKTASDYEITDMDETDYMFLEWKSGDYSFRHEKPKYYVLERVVKEKKN